MVRRVERARRLTVGGDLSAERLGILEALADRIDATLWMADPDLSVWHYMNKACTVAYGFTAEAATADPSLVTGRFHPDDASLVDAALERARAGHDSEVLYRMRLTDGSYRWQLTRVFPIFDENGRVHRLIGTGTEVTELKQLEDQLAEALEQAAVSNERFESIASTIDVLFWLATPDLQEWIYVNQAVEESFGYEPDDLYASPSLFVESIHPDDLDLVVGRLAEVGNGRSVEVEFRLRRRTGEYAWVWAQGYPRLDDRGEVVQIMGTAIDITERKELEAALRLSQEEAQAANRAKSAFLATMAHEIRTPMIGVTGMLEVLSHTDLDAEQQRTVAVVRQSADNLLQILGDVLDVSKIEAGRLDLNPSPTDLRALVGGVVQNLMPPASSKGLVLDLSVDAALAPAHLVDPVRIRQVLTNLVSNALKFTEDGGVHVSLHVLEDRGAEQLVELAVTDTGIGIAPEHQARLFEPFTQADDTTTRRFGGTGLGLNICHLLAELMQGDLTMESAVGVGTTMRFAVPLTITGSVETPTTDAAPSLVRVRGAATTRDEARAAGTLLLLVEDHPVNRLVITKQLGLAGFVTDTAEDGREGLERWAEGGYALVFSDIHMPEMDGLDLVRALRAQEAAEQRPRTPVVALTAATLRDEVEAALEAGMDDVMVKPTTVPVLTDALRRWLGHLDWEEVADGAADAAPSAPSEPLPRSQLLEDVRASVDTVSGGDADVSQELLQQLDRSTRDDLDVLDVAVAQRDASVVAQRAHRIKGSSRTIGATEIAQLADVLEHAAPDGDWVRLEGLAAAVRGALTVLLDRLEVSASRR